MFDEQSREFDRALSPAWLERWQRFKEQIGVDDELWYWEYLPEPLTGAAGYCILRNGNVVTSIAVLRA